MAEPSNAKEMPETDNQGLKAVPVPPVSGIAGAEGEEGQQAASPELEAAQKRIQELEAQVKDKESKHLYLYADFENYKKRAIKERSDATKFGWENVARELILVADNLERALTHIPAGTDKNLADGLTMILQQFRSTMQKQGVQAIEAVGKPFDPEFHEAVGQEPSDKPQGTVLRDVLQGYTLHGRLLRPSNVIISQGPLAN